MSSPLRTIAILRGYDVATTCDLAVRSWDAGFDLVEVPVQSELAWEALEAVASLRPSGELGAGTVLDPADVRRAVDLGCTTIISPGVDEEVVVAAQQCSVQALPGVLSPTDVQRALRLGLTTVKLFPASVGGCSLLAALRGPFPQVNFVAVGGVDPDNIEDWIGAGASGVALASSLRELLARRDAADLVAAVHGRLDSA